MFRPIEKSTLSVCETKRLDKNPLMYTTSFQHHSNVSGKIFRFHSSAQFLVQERNKHLVTLKS